MSTRRTRTPLRPVGWDPSWRPPPSADVRKNVDRLLNLLKIVNREVPSDRLANFAVPDFSLRVSYLPDEPNQRLAIFEEVRAWAEDGLHHLADTGRWKSGPSVEVVITSNGPEYIGSAEDCAGLYKSEIKELLAHQAWRVSRCARAKCRKLFIRKGRSEYCNSKCSNAERASRVYAKKKNAVRPK